MDQTKISWLKITTIAFVSVSLSSCMVGPNFHRPPPIQTARYTALPLPHKTTRIPGIGSAGVAQYFVKSRDIPGQWWALFHSPQLNKLIQEGITNSPTLAEAKAALVQARDLLRAQIGESYSPSIGLAMTTERAKISGLTFGFVGGNIFDIYLSELQSSYILDLFGKQRRLVENARAEVDYQRYELLAAYLSLTSNIATNYIDIASLQAQIKTILQIIQEQADILALVKKQFRVGGASKNDVLTQETLLAQTKAELPPLRKSLASTQHALAILIGRLPSELMPRSYRLDALRLPKKLPVTIPSFLVSQRPDVEGAIALLHQASAEIGVATANLFPQITLSASYGHISDMLSKFFDARNAIWNIGASLLQSIFQGGSLIAKKHAAVAAFQLSFAQYHQTVLTAFKEVSDTLRAITFDAKELSAQYQAEASAKRTLDITANQFRVGGTNYLNVLTAEKNYHQAKLNRVKAQAARFTDTVVLFQDLGGGWWNNSINVEALQLAGQHQVKPIQAVALLPPPKG